jgi:uncharacterized protein (TIGR00369 family)
MSGNARLRRLVETITNLPGLTSHFGTQVVSVGTGHVELAITHAPHLLQFSGALHGGVIAALADHAAGAAVSTLMPEDRIAATVDLHVNYLAPANGQTLTARAHATHVGRSISVAQVDLFTVVEGVERRCAIATATMKAVPRPAIQR